MGQSTKMSNTGLQQQGSAGNGAPPAMVPAAGGASVTVGPGNGPKKARSGYNAKAMAEIRNSLRPYEDSNPTIGQLNMGNLVGMQTGSITISAGPTGVRPVSSLSTGSSSNSNYSDCIASLINLGFDEESSSDALNRVNGNVSVALDLLREKQRLRMDNLQQLQNSDLINGPGRPTRILRNHASEQHNTQQTMTITDTTTLNQIRSESPAIVLNSNGLSNNLQSAEIKNSQAPPALPPRSSQKEPPPRIPAHPSISNTSAIPNSDAQQATVGINSHPLIGRKYSPNSTTPLGTISNSVVQNTDAPPLPPPRGAQNPPPTPPPVHPRGTTPPPVAAVTAASVTQQINHHAGALNPPPLLKRMSPVPVGHGTRVTMQQFNGNVGGTPIYTQSGHSRDDSPPIGNLSASGHPQPVRPKNSQEIQQQLQNQLQTMASNLQPNWLCENNAEPPPPYPMGTAAVAANPPPSYSQSMTLRQSPTLSMSSTSSEYRRSPAPPLPTNQFVHPYSNHQFSSHQMLNNANNTATMNSTTLQQTIVSATPVVQQSQFITVQSPLPTSPSPSVMSSYSGTSSSMYGRGIATRNVQTHSPVIMQSVKSTQVQKPILQTATGVATMAAGGTDIPQQQQMMVQSQAVVATPATGIVHHGIATSVALPLSQQQQQQQQTNMMLNSNNVNGVGGTITPIGNHVTDGVATPPPPSYEFSMQVKQQQQRTSPVVSSRHQMHMPSPITVPRAIQPSPATVDKGASQLPLPPPPPYPSTAVSLNNNQFYDINQQLVNGTSVSAKQAPVVISTAKVVGTALPTSTSSNANLVRTIETKHSALQRKYSPLTSETGSSTAASRSESPISDSHTVSAASPLSFASTNGVINNVVNTTLCNMNNNVASYEINPSIATTTQDSGVETFSSLPPSLPSNSTPGGMASLPAPSASLSMPAPPPYRPNHHVSPKPERRQISTAKEEARKESLIRSCPPQAFKFFMEQHIENVIKEYEKRRDRRMRLERELVQITRESDIQITENDKDKMRMALERKETNYLRMRRAKLNKSHFKKIKDIGVGAFGKVSLVRSVYGTGQNRPGGLYAMKTLKKNQVLAKNQVAHVWSEKDILSEADNDWIVKLYYSFQDNSSLYFVMEYIPGGDLMSMLIKEGTFSEERSRFTVAEIICAVESVHNLRFIHRDIKPDNILIDANGHIKLTDFGLCTGFRWTHSTESYQSKNGHAQHYRQDSMDPMNMDFSGGNCSCPLTANGMKPLERRRRKQEQREFAHSLVGTPNYIAPEILDRKGYTQTCDWWSVGVILYEMIIGRPPFNADENIQTQKKVINWRKHLHIPPVVHSNHGTPRAVSAEAQDLIRKLCCDASNRLGTGNGASDIKKHPFFKDVNFRNIRKQRAPAEAIPKITHPEDTSNFEEIDDPGNYNSDDDENGDDISQENGRGQGGSSRGNNLDNNHQGFYEFTFRRFFDDGGYPLQNGEYGSQFSEPPPSNSYTYDNQEVPERPPPVYV